jgi:hypothetical protein
MEKLEEVYTIKSKGPPEYYLRNDIKKYSKGCWWAIGCKKHLKEAVMRVAAML